MKTDKNAEKQQQIPLPPQHRINPLPWQQPKSFAEDPDAPQRIKDILDSDSYKLADQDAEFLNLDNTRGIRLQIDYQKAELLLQQHGIKHTVVVFGSTRIHEPIAAQAKVNCLRKELDKDGQNLVLKKQLVVAERILAKSHYYQVAQEFGQLVSNASRASKSQLVIMTGGGPGIMEAANRGAYNVGAKSIGLNIHLPNEQYPNPYITTDLCFSFHYFALRKLHFLLRTRALVAFPGGYGTFDELFETLTLIQTRKIKPLPVVLIGESYWRQAFNIDFLVDEGVIDEEDRHLFWFAETAQDAWDGILEWYDRAGEPLLVG
jgi:uncharacterized protein (TIGR00730 family)